MTTTTAIEELKTRIRKLNSKAGQMKMALHDLAEGLPQDYEQLIDLATETYNIFQQLATWKAELKLLEAAS